VFPKFHMFSVPTAPERHLSTACRRWPGTWCHAVYVSSLFSPSTGMHFGEEHDG